MVSKGSRYDQESHFSKKVRKKKPFRISDEGEHIKIAGERGCEKREKEFSSGIVKRKKMMYKGSPA